MIMKNSGSIAGKLAIVLSLFALLAGHVAAKAFRVRVSEPGTLAQLIGERNKNRITALKVNGRLNSSDLRFLREMAGCDAWEKPTAGRLSRIDMGEVTFASGGEPYSYREQEQYTSGEHIVPRFLFRKCAQLTDIVLPRQTEKVDVGALEYTSIRRLVLPEGCSLEDYALNMCRELEEIVFPKYLAAIKMCAVMDNPKLTSLSLNDVGYIAAYAFGNLPAVEKIEVKGYVGHMDGYYTVNNCARLQQVDFRGPVLSTGGPAAFADCPRLEHVVFHDLVASTHFGAPEKCAAFKGYVARGLVGQSSFGEWMAATPMQGGDAQLYDKAFRSLRELQRHTAGRSDVLSGNRWVTGYLYRRAASLAGEGRLAEACDHLELGTDLGGLFYYDLKRNKTWEPLRQDARFAGILAKARETGDYLHVLKKSGAYRRAADTAAAAGCFTYDAPDDTILTRIRTYFNLDSIAGGGDEISRIKNVMYWLHDAIPHDGSSSWPKCPLNAVDMYELAKRENRGLNCRMLAFMLNDCYLALGYPSRFVTCLPRAFRTDNDCHVINVVWSKELGKWVWMDASFAAYVTDENGLLLHPGEVRQRLIDGRPLVLNEDANWNHRSIQTKEHYLEEYMAKNLYWMECHLRSCSESESNDARRSGTASLCPEGFTGYGNAGLTHDDIYFWQAPAGR